VDGKRFRQCINLLLEIPVDDIREFDQIESIDEVTKKLRLILIFGGIQFASFDGNPFKVIFSNLIIEKEKVDKEIDL